MSTSSSHVAARTVHAREQRCNTKDLTRAVRVVLDDAPHVERITPPDTSAVKTGRCRHCNRRVSPHEGRMHYGRWEHHDCERSIARMDAARRAKGKKPVQGRTLHAGTSQGQAGIVTTISMATGEILDRQAPLSPRQVERIVVQGRKRPRTLDDRSAHAGGGADHT